jgi:hypothetical protein
MKADNVGDEEGSECRSISKFHARDEVGHLGHFIDEHEDRIHAVRHRQVRNEVTG